MITCLVGSCQRHGKCMYIGHPQCPERKYVVVTQGRQQGKTYAMAQLRRNQIISNAMILWLAEHVPNPTTLTVRPEVWESIKHDEAVMVDKSINATGDRYCGLLIVVNPELHMLWRVQ